MAGERFALKAREKLSAYIETNLPAQLAAVETAMGLDAGLLGRPSSVVRGFNPADARDNKVEVYVNGNGPKNLIDRQLFDAHLEVAFTLLAADALVVPVQERLLRWESAWWLLMDKGATTLGGTVNAALCSSFSQDTVHAPNGTQIAIGVAQVLVTIQEN